MTHFAWLVESHKYSEPEYLRLIRESYGHPRNDSAKVDWTKHANMALRFDRKQDAELFMILMQEYTVLCTAVEHGFMDEVPRIKGQTDD